jgi:hypothetical protein
VTYVTLPLPFRKSFSDMPKGERRLPTLALAHSREPSPAGLPASPGTGAFTMSNKKPGNGQEPAPEQKPELTPSPSTATAAYGTPMERHHMSAEDVDAIDQQAADQGLRVRRILVGKDFLPNRDSEAAMALMLPKPRGHYELLGYIRGVVTGLENHEKDFEGRVLKSVWANGFFEGIVEATGEIITSISFISPGSSFGLLLTQAFLAGADRVELDLELGLERTSRQTIYEWAVTSYATGVGQRLVRPIAERQEARLRRRAMSALPKPPTAA